MKEGTKMKTIKRTSAIILALCLIISVFSACSLLNPASKLLGAWRDSTGTVGYEFKKDNIVSITYADFTIPIINVRYDGTVDGTYSVKKNENGSYIVTVNYTILSQTLSKSYFFTVENNALTLSDTEDGTQTVLMKYTPETTTAQTSESTTAPQQ